MHQYKVGELLDRVAMDIAGPFDDGGNRYLLTATDYFTKWPEVYAFPNQGASIVSDASVTNVFCRFGVPREMHSDQGRTFAQWLMQEVLQRRGTSKTRTTPQHSQSDGMVERYMKTVEGTADGRFNTPERLR
jgi:transposase InsO family protein